MPGSTQSRRGQRLQPVGEQVVAGLAQDGLGVELHSLDREVSVGQAHHDSGVGTCGDPKALRDAGFGDRQRVIPRRGERRGQAREHSGPVVMNPAGLAVPQLRSSLHRRAVVLGDDLMPEADPQDRRLPGEPLDDGVTRGRLSRCTGTGRQQDAVEVGTVQFLDGDVIGLTNRDRRAQRRQIVDDRVDERVPAVHDQNPWTTQPHLMLGHDPSSAEGDSSNSKSLGS